MANGFAEAVTQSMLAGMDPNAQLVKGYMETYVANSRHQLNQQYIDVTIQLQKLIDEGKAANPPVDGNVIEAWRRMLDSYAAKVAASK